VGRRQLRKLVKLHEPHGWLHGAINVQGWRGESRQGGEKPRRRNKVGRWLRLIRSAGSNAGAGVDSSTANDGGAIFGNPYERHLVATRKVLLEAKMVASEKVT